ncbi:MAG: tyrosine-type recombinase/integrase [Nitrospiraceae bacterium]
MKLTKQSLKSLEPPASGYTLHWDSELRGFGVRITASGQKSYILQRRIKGRSHRLTICRVEDLAPDEARKRAEDFVGEIAKGKDPVAEMRRERLESKTLEEALTEYVENKDLKPRTVADMRKVIERLLKPWLRKPLTSITPEMVSQLHRRLGKSSSAQANLAFKYLRAIYNYATSKYLDSEGSPIVISNPVARLSKDKSWHRVDRRQTVIKPRELSAWYQGVITLPANARDYLLFVLFTGLRAGEAATLEWVNVDLTEKSFRVPDTKNRTTHELPLSDFLHQMLSEKNSHRRNEFVFHGLHGKGHIACVGSAIRQVTKLSEVKFCLHDLRRTFATTAEGLNISTYAVKRLLNHVQVGDVTSGYIVRDVERLRKPMQQITDHLLSKFAGHADE